MGHKLAGHVCIRLKLNQMGIPLPSTIGFLLNVDLKIYPVSRNKYMHHGSKAGNKLLWSVNCHNQLTYKIMFHRVWPKAFHTENSKKYSATAASTR